MAFGMQDLRRLSGLGAKEEPKVDYNMQADSALEKIMMSIGDIPDEVLHHAANLTNEQKSIEYGQAIAEALIEAANKIKSEFGIQ